MGTMKYEVLADIPYHHTYERYSNIRDFLIACSMSVYGKKKLKIN